MSNYKIIKEKYTAQINGEDGTLVGLYDHRDFPLVNLVDGEGGFGTLAYTLTTDDITRGTKPELTPYIDRKAAFTSVTPTSEGVTGVNTELGIRLLYGFSEDSLTLTVVGESPHISQFGLDLCFNFMGKKNTDYTEQLLASSPYCSEDGNFMYWLLTRPNGRYVMVTALEKCAGWKLDYSSFSAGHFFENLKMLSAFDRAYGGGGNQRIALKIEFPDQPEDTVKRAADNFSMPAAHFPVSGGRINENLPVVIEGGWEHLIIMLPDGTQRQIPFEGSHQVMCRLEQYGIHTVIPVKEGKHGLDCKIFAFDDYQAMFRRNCDRLKKPYHNDENLCEGGVWARALCKYGLIYGERAQDIPLIQEHLSNILCENTGQAIPRYSIISVPSLNYPPYHIYRSTRIQEQFFGVSFLLEIYQLWGKEAHLEYAVGALLSMLKHYVAENGAIMRPETAESLHIEDYTTVTPLVLTVVDMANFLKGKNDGRWSVFEEYALKITDFLVERGVDFPTEGELTDLKEREMEDGSISCTALSVLYTCFFLREKPGYIAFAEKIMRLHDAWSIYTPDARMYRSSLRWWETAWEGDTDGPAICAGHAWTIWRGEAEFYQALLACDTVRLMDSYNAFMTNWAKIQPDGTSYACWQPDYITGGGFTKNCENIEFRIARGFPRKEDHSLSKYVWIRAADTWLKTVAVVDCKGFKGALNGSLSQQENGVLLKPFISELTYLYLDGYKGILTVSCHKSLRIITREKLCVIRGFNGIQMGNSFYLTPDHGEICIRVL